MLQDSLRSVRHYYYKSPQFVKNIVGGAYRKLPDRLLLGKTYREFTNLLEASVHWNKQEHEDYQYEQVKNVINQAYNNIDFYREKYDQYGVKPTDFRYLDDLKKFPLVSKKEVKENFERMINRNFPKWKYLLATTGGSTAEPMKFLQIKGVTRSKEKAFIGAGWGRTGYRYGNRVVQLKGRPVGEPSKKIFWEYEPIQNTLEMDSNYLTAENVPLFVGAILKFKPEYIIGFPSSLYLLAKHMKHLNLTIPRVKGIMLASENVYAWQREELQKTFQCRIYSHYGHSEMVLLGMESPSNHDLLFFPQYGYLEIMGADGVVKTTLGDEGELVGTSFHNPLMPFIRFRTQDKGKIGARHTDFPDYPCLKDIEGRLQEFIITRDGRGISVCTMGAAHFSNLENVSETQYFQERMGELEFHIVPRNGFTDDERKIIQANLQRKVGDGVNVVIRTVPSIQRTRSGKHMMLVQKLNHTDFNFDRAELI